MAVDDVRVNIKGGATHNSKVLHLFAQILPNSATTYHHYCNKMADPIDIVEEIPFLEFC